MEKDQHNNLKNKNVLWQIVVLIVFPFLENQSEAPGLEGNHKSVKTEQKQA